MTIKTNLTYETLARWSAMMYNFGEDIRTADGDIITQRAEEEDEFILNNDVLADEGENAVENLTALIEDAWLANWDADYREGDRSESAVCYHKERAGYLKMRRSLKKALAAFKCEECAEWEYNTDAVELLKFPDGSKAVANI